MIFCTCLTKPELVSDGELQRICHVCKRVPAPNDARLIKTITDVRFFDISFDRDALPGHTYKVVQPV